MLCPPVRQAGPAQMLGVGAAIWPRVNPLNILDSGEEETDAPVSLTPL